MRPSEILRRAERYLQAHGVESPRATAELLLSDTLGTDRAGVYSRAEGLTSAQARSFGRALCRRCTGTPAQHITGRQQFRHLELDVRPGVFVPRAETETVVDVALDAIGGVDAPLVVDVGTGAGALALSIKQERPRARVWATDLSAGAVALATANAAGLGLDVTVLQGDLLEPLPAELAGRVDLVVSNPPYIGAEEFDSLPPEVRADPELSLLGGTDVHRRLGDEAKRWLREGGALVMEIGAGQGDEVATILDGRFRDVRVVQDLAGRDRVVVGRRA